MSLHAVILAGGRGERFWPLSRSDSPKQMLPLLGAETLLGATVRRVQGRIPAERTWIVIGSDLRPAVERLELPLPADRFLWEPVGRNTAAAIGAAAERILIDDPPAHLLVMPSDHWIPDSAGFWTAVSAGEAATEHGFPLVTFGVRPTYPETGYGYVERAESIPGVAGGYRVARFHEKPEASQAEAYLRKGGCYWNSGIFLFQGEAIAGELRRHLPEMAGALDELRRSLREGLTVDAWRRYFEAAAAISIDHGVMERAESVAVIEAEFAWSDLGNWTSLGDHLPADPQGNHHRGEVVALESDRCVLYSEPGGLLAVLGVKDLIVVRVGDATLVCPRERAQEVRRLVRKGKADDRLRRFF